MQNPPGALHLTLESSIQEDLLGLSPEKRHKMVSGLKYPFCLEGLSELRLLVLKKRRLQGDLIEAFSTCRGQIR